MPKAAARPTTYPLHVFRFQVDFTEAHLSGGAGGPKPLCGGAFSECTGLEANMEPVVIEEGGRNFGANQRVGKVSFATVVLKRGLTANDELWKWFELVGRGASAYRLKAEITMHDHSGQPVMKWVLERALPVKFKAADLNAMGADVGIEELHLAHEGLRIEVLDASPNAADGEATGGAAPASGGGGT